jgi:predicted RNase H-like HicB family nuclease
VVDSREKKTPLRKIEQCAQASRFEAMTRRYAIVIEKGPKSFGAYVPDLPGCVAVARTRPAVLKSIREAIALHLEDLRERGGTLPKAAASADYVEVAV